MRYETPLTNEYGDIIRVEGMDDMTDVEDVGGSEETGHPPAFKLADAEEPAGETRLKDPSDYPDSDDSGSAGIYDSSKEFDMSNYKVIERLEKMRKRLHFVDIFTTVFFLGIIAFIFFGRMFPRVMIQYLDRIMQFTMLLPFVMMGCMLGIMLPKVRKKKVFQKEFKEKLVFPILRKHFDDLTYYWDGVFTNVDVRGFGLTAMGNRFKTEDHIIASYRGIKFNQADVVIRNKSGKNTYTYFTGRMFAFQYPDMKHVDRVKIYSKRFDYRAGYGGMRRVHLENLEYDKKYDTYTVSEHDAFYLLTPQLMERILKLGEKYPNFAIHFCGQMVYVGVDNLKDSMDPPMNKPLDYVDIMQKIKEDVQVIKDLVDILELVPLSEDI